MLKYNSTEVLNKRLLVLLPSAGIVMLIFVTFIASILQPQVTTSHRRLIISKSDAQQIKKYNKDKLSAWLQANKNRYDHLPVLDFSNTAGCNVTRCPRSHTFTGHATRCHRPNYKQLRAYYRSSKRETRLSEEE